MLAVKMLGPRRAERSAQMPICYIDAPPGISPAAKKRMMEKITAAIEEGYNKIGDTFIFLREDKLENVMVNGRTATDNPKHDEFLKAQASRDG
jgi:phenylpyruvate tautomerase PptA (4-oxalocrotonate tautomerase family)